MKKNIILVNYTYPPFNSIGSRRWAKFSKQLAKNGHKIHVIYSKNPYNSDSVWTKDTLNANIIKYELNNYWPKFAFNPSKNLINRTANKIFLALIDTFFKGIPNDESRFWKKPLQKILYKICTENKIDIIIASGPPFRVLLHSLIKEEFPEIIFYSDLRDEWLTGKLFNSKISRSNYLAEKKIQELVISKSDKILVTDLSNKKSIENSYNKLTTELKIIPHTIDLDEFPTKNNSVNINKEKFKFIYGGNLPMIGKEDNFIPFLNALEELKDNNLELYNKTEFSFYINSKWIISEVEKRNLTNFNFYNLTSPIKFNEAATLNNYLLVFLPDHLKNYLITKNIDYLPHKKPIVLCSNKGSASDFIEENKIGIHLNCEENIYEQLKKLLTTDLTFDPKNYEALISKYSLERITNDLLDA